MTAPDSPSPASPGDSPVAEELDRLKEVLTKQQALVQRLTEGLREIEAQQPKTVGWLRANGIIFDGPLGTDPDNWEHVAFSIYSDLCEVDAKARALLAVSPADAARVPAGEPDEGGEA